VALGLERAQPPIDVELVAHLAQRLAQSGRRCLGRDGDHELLANSGVPVMGAALKLVSALSMLTACSRNTCATDWTRPGWSMDQALRRYGTAADVVARPSSAGVELGMHVGLGREQVQIGAKPLDDGVPCRRRASSWRTGRGG